MDPACRGGALGGISHEGYVEKAQVRSEGAGIPASCPFVFGSGRRGMCSTTPRGMQPCREAARTATPPRRIPAPVAYRPAAHFRAPQEHAHRRPSKPRNPAPRPRENRPSVRGRCSTLGGAVCCALTLERRDNSWLSEPARLIQGCGGAAADYAYPALLKRSLELQMRRTAPPAVRSTWHVHMARMGSAVDARSNARPGER